jgi:hypothetical protein
MKLSSEKDGELAVKRVKKVKRENGRDKREIDLFKASTRN